MLDICDSGWVSCRAYWTKACSKPKVTCPPDHTQAADQGHPGEDQVADEQDGRLHRAGHRLRRQAAAVQRRVALVELRTRCGLVPEHLDQRVPGVAFLDLAIEHAGRLPLLGELRLGLHREQGRQSDRCHHSGDADERQPGRQDQHHRQHADQAQQRHQQLAQQLLQALADVVDVVGHAAEHLAARLLVEPGQRQARQLVLGLLAQRTDDALQQARAEPGLPPVQRRSPRVEQGHERQQARELPGVDGAVAGDTGIDLVRRTAELPGAHDVQHHAAHGGHQDRGQLRGLGHQQCHQAADRGTPMAHFRASTRPCRRHAPDAHRRGTLRAGRVTTWRGRAHISSAAARCDATISR